MNSENLLKYFQEKVPNIIQAEIFSTPTPLSNIDGKEVISVVLIMYKNSLDNIIKDNINDINYIYDINESNIHNTSKSKKHHLKDDDFYSEKNKVNVNLELTNKKTKRTYKKGETSNKKNNLKSKRKNSTKKKAKIDQDSENQELNNTEINRISKKTNNTLNQYLIEEEKLHKDFNIDKKFLVMHDNIKIDNFYNSDYINVKDMDEVESALKIINIRIFHNSFVNISNIRKAKFTGDVEVLHPRGGVEIQTLNNENILEVDFQFSLNNINFLDTIFYIQSSLNLFIPNYTTKINQPLVSYNRHFMKLYEERRSILQRHYGIQNFNIFESKILTYNLYLIIDQSESMKSAISDLIIEIKNSPSIIKFYVDNSSLTSYREFSMTSLLDRIYDVSKLALPEESILIYSDFEDSGEDDLNLLLKQLKSKKQVLYIISTEFKPNSELIKVAIETGGTYRYIHF